TGGGPPRHRERNPALLQAADATVTSGPLRRGGAAASRGTAVVAAQRNCRDAYRSSRARALRSQSADAQAARTEASGASVSTKLALAAPRCVCSYGRGSVLHDATEAVAARHGRSRDSIRKRAITTIGHPNCTCASAAKTRGSGSRWGWAGDRGSARINGVGVP